MVIFFDIYYLCPVRRSNGVAISYTKVLTPSSKVLSSKNHDIESMRDVKQLYTRSCSHLNGLFTKYYGITGINRGGDQTY